MNQKCIKLLTNLYTGEMYKISQLADNLGVSVRLLRYHIAEASEFLYNEGLPEISVDRHTGVQLKLTDSQHEHLRKVISELDSYNYSLSSQERRAFILLNLASISSFQTSGYFAECLSVSKSCIDKDIALLKQDTAINGSECFIEGKTGSGIRLVGSERKIRLTCLELIERNLDFSSYLNSESCSNGFVDRSIRALLGNEYLDFMIGIVKKAEAKTGKRLSYNSFKDISLYLSIMVMRICLKKLITLPRENLSLIESNLECNEFADLLVQEITNEFSIGLSESEVGMIKLMLMSAKYSLVEPLDHSDWPFIQVLVDNIIDRMCRLLKFNFKDDDELRNALQLHIEPMVYKLKNHVPVINPSLSVIKSNYRDVFDALTAVIASLDTELLVGITEDDVAYLALHFCASMERRKRFAAISRIAIVCIHGIGTASLIKELVCSRFRTIRVVKTITSSEIKNADFSEVDFVISSIDVGRSDIPWLTINAIPTEEDFRKIDCMIQRYSYKEPHTEDTLTFFTDILGTVEQYCIISKTGEFMSALAECFARMGIKIRLDKLQPSLAEIMGVSSIKTGVEADNREQATMSAGRILVENGFATEEIIDSLVETVRAAGPYSVICKGVALVHGKVGRGVIKMGMSLAVLKEPVSFYHPQNDPVKIVICLAATDSYSHVTALKNLIHLLERNDIESIAAGTPYEIHKMIEDTKDMEG